MKRGYLAAVLMISACSGNQITITSEPVTDDSATEEEGGGTVIVPDGTISIVYSEDGATVTGDEAGIVTVDGCDVTVNNTSDACLTYELSGTCSDGFFKLYSETKQEIRLCGLTLANPDGAAINNQSHKYTSVVISGENSLSDGPVNASGDYNDQTGDEDMKAAFFSEGQLVFSGDGTLTVTATGKSAITSDDYISITGSPAINMTSTSGHGLRAQEKILISGGTTDITVSATGKKGITTDGDFYMSAGRVTVTSTSSSGTVDGELTGAAGIKTDASFTIDGGDLTITVSGTGAKGINCDGNGWFNAGTVNVTATGANYGSSSGGWRGWGDDSSSKSAKAIKCDGNLVFAGAEVTAGASSHEAIEAKGTITVSAGSVTATSSDDAINSGSDMTITGGAVSAVSTGNDGLDANGNMYIQGGYVYAVGSGSPEVALDANTEQNCKLYISGGSLVAFGGIESGSSISQPVISVSSWTSGASYSLYNGDTLLLEFTAPSRGGSGLVLSHPDLVSGSSYTLKCGSQTSTVTASMSASGGGTGGGGDRPGGGGGPGGGGRH